MRTADRGRSPGAERRLLRGYGPLLAVLTGFLLMVTLVPTVAREQTVIHDSGAAGAASVGTTEPGVAAPVPGIPGTGATIGGTGASVTIRHGAASRTGACPDRRQQVPGDPYSPPCVAFSGDNGGATSHGVTRDTIVVAVRQTSDPDLASVMAKIAGSDVIDSPADTLRTTQGLVDYFNSRFQLYGRRIKLVPFEGRGSLFREILGAGQEQANGDAIKVASEVGAFAEINALSEPYADALARQRVMAFGAPFMSRNWFVERRPYAWSMFTDCSILAELNADWLNRRIFGGPAKYAGGDLAGRPRKVALIIPENPVYEQCLDDGQGIIRAAGNDDTAISYTLDLTSLSNQAASIVAKLKSLGVTSVSCGCDPVFLTFLTAKAHEQDYYPEWLVWGVGLNDTDLVGQFYDQTEWAHAFGISPLGDQLPERAGLGYNAYKAVRPDEPAHSVEIIYDQLYLLALGLQLAGPQLTPATFERGMFGYPGGSGPDGSWGFGPGHYTPTQDYKEIWWDRRRTSPTNDKPGAYVTTGARYRRGQVPPGDPQVFR